MPRFSEMTKSEFLKGMQNVNNDPEKFFEEQTKDLDPSAEDYQQKLYAEKRSFLIHCINSDIDEPTFAQDIKGDKIFWNTENDELLTGAADQLYPSNENGTDITVSDANAQYKMTDLFLQKVENAGVDDPHYSDARLLQQIINNFSPMDIWEKKYRIREAFIGERLISKTASEDVKNEHLQDINKIKNKLNQNVDNILANDYIDNGVDDEYIVIDNEKQNQTENDDINLQDLFEEKPEIKEEPKPVFNVVKEEPKPEIKEEPGPAGPVIVEDPKGKYRIERIDLPEENAKNALIDKLASDAPAAEKENWLFSYMLRDLSDEDFKKRVAFVKQDKQLNGLAGNIISTGTMEDVGERLFTENFENKVKSAFTELDGSAAINIAMQAGSMIARYKDALKKEDEERKQNELRAKQQEEQKAQEDKIRSIKFETLQRLDLIERRSIVDLYDEAYEIKRKANLPHANEESKAKSAAVDIYLKDLFSRDPQKADAFYHRMAVKKANFFFLTGADLDQELLDMKNAKDEDDVWLPFKDFAEDKEMSSAAVSMMMYNTTKYKCQIDAFDEIDKLIPGAEKQKYEQYIKEYLEPLDSFMGNPKELYQMGINIKSESKKAEALGFKHDPKMKYPIITDVARAELQSRKNEPAVQNTVVRKQSNKETIRSYDSALAKFNTSRASIFKQESRTHERARLAAENLRELRKQLDVTNPSTHFVRLGKAKDQREFAKQWLDAANTLAYESGRYISRKSPLTFAGRDRKSGATDLKRLATNEIRLCENAIKNQAEKTEFNVKDIYLDIAKDKLNAAGDVIRNADYSIPEAEQNGKSIADQMKEKKEIVKNAIYDAVAASASQNQLSGENVQNTEANYYNLRKHLEQNPVFQQALTTYLNTPSNWGKNSILYDLENGAGRLISKLKDTNRQLNMDNVIRPQQPQQRHL